MFTVVVVHEAVQMIDVFLAWMPKKIQHCNLFFCLGHQFLLWHENLIVTECGILERAFRAKEHWNINKEHFNCTVANQTQHSHQSTCFSFTDQIYTLTRCLVQDWMSRHRLVTFTSQNILIYIYLIFVTKYKAFDILSDREDSKCSK